MSGSRRQRAIQARQQWASRQLDHTVSHLMSGSRRRRAIQALMLKAAEAHVVTDDVQDSYHLTEDQHPALPPIHNFQPHGQHMAKILDTIILLVKPSGLYHIHPKPTCSYPYLKVDPPRHRFYDPGWEQQHDATQQSIAELGSDCMQLDRR